MLRVRIVIAGAFSKEIFLIVKRPVSGTETIPRIGHVMIVSRAGCVVYPSPTVLTRWTRRLDTHLGSGHAFSDSFQNAPGPFPATIFPEAELLQMASPGVLVSGRRIRPFRPLLEPGLQLRSFRQVRIESGDPLPDHDLAA